MKRPLFAVKNIRVLEKRILGKQKNTLKMRLADETGCIIDGIMFGDAEELSREISYDRKISILYYPRINQYGGRRSIQLEIKDIS